MEDVTCIESSLQHGGLSSAVNLATGRHVIQVSQNAEQCNQTGLQATSLSATCASVRMHETDAIWDHPPSTMEPQRRRQGQANLTAGPMRTFKQKGDLVANVFTSHQPKSTASMSRSRRCTPGGECVGVISPNKFDSSAEALVTPGQGGVDDVLPVAADRNKAAVWVVLQGLRVQVAAAQILHCQRQSLSLHQE